MKKEVKEPFPFGNYLKKLRVRKGVSLMKVEEATGISNAYLSQLENGIRRRIPTSKRLNALADYYNVSIEQLLEKAGYVKALYPEEKEEEIIKKSFLKVIGDPHFKYGIRLKNKNDLDYMRFVNEIYEELTKKNETLFSILLGIQLYEIVLKSKKKDEYSEFESSMIKEIKKFIEDKKANKDTVLFPLKMTDEVQEIIDRYWNFERKCL